jgi:UPF0755 protein
MSLKRLIIAFAFVLLFTAAGGSFWLMRTVNAPHEHSKANEFITIEKGSTPKDIIGKLTAEGVVSNYMATLIYVRLFGDSSKLQAGEYQFPSPITNRQVLKVLEKGETQTTKLSIPEGFTRFDIAKRIAEKFPQDPPADDKAILALMDDVTLIHDIAPNAKNLEGYMYPSTYSFPRDAAAKDIIKTMVEQFRKVWKPEWTAAAQAAGRTPEEIVIIASLIETETAVESERPIVAGVINNRLSRNIPLGIDQTNVYIAKMFGRWDGTINKSDLEVNSPYNTRIKTGLPPGPISSVSESALKAALFPSANNYLYYVRNVDLNDGSHWFYSSAADFEKGKAKYQQWLAQEREKMKPGAPDQASQ